MKREYSLDILKLIATTFIIFHHYQQLTGAFFENTINFSSGSFYWGYLVELFFILSGYFMYSYSMKIDSTSSFFDFFKKKYLRFLPMLMISGIACAILTFYIPEIKNFTFSYSAWNIISGITGIGLWFSNNLIVNNPTWYISVLLLCYVLFFAITFIAKKLSISATTAYAVTLFIAIQMHSIVTQYNICVPLFTSQIARGYICFFEGLLLYRLFDYYKIHQKKSCICFSWLIIISFVLLYIKNTSVLQDNLYFILCFLLFPSIILVFKSNLIVKLFDWSIFKDIGSISYNAFMWHIFVIAIIQSLPINKDSVNTMLLTTLFVYVMGIISYYFIDRIISGIIKKRTSS